MKIEEFSRNSGFSVDTLRYYDKIGLLVPERLNGIRNYSEEDLQEAVIIKRLKTLNFSIQDIKNMIELDEKFEEDKSLDYEGRARVKEFLKIVEDKYSELEQQYDLILKTMKQMERIIKKSNKLLKYGFPFAEDIEEMLNYKETESYWDGVFKGLEPSDERRALPEKIEDGLKWVSENSKLVMDFGCGNGKTIFKCLSNGVSRGIGIDLSQEGINLCLKTAANNEYTDRAEFICGGIDCIKNMSDGSVDGIILFNILDNIMPADMLVVLEQCHRILKDNGKLLVKLNPYIEDENIIINSGEFKKVAANLYIENTGVIFNNIVSEQFEKIIEHQFSIYKYDSISINDFEQRLYYAYKK